MQDLNSRGWSEQWLERDLPAFTYYTNIVTYLLLTCILGLALKGLLSIRNCSRELKDDPSKRAAISARAHKRVLEVCRGHFRIASAYVANVSLIFLIDGAISLVDLFTTASSHPDKWTLQFIALFTVMMGFAVIIIGAVLVGVPLLQMIFMTWLLARLARKQGKTTLADYISEARLFSTHIGQFCAMICFYLTAWWSPIGIPLYMTCVRWILIYSAFSSALAWLDASWAFNFCADKLADKDIGISSPDIEGIVRMFAETAQTVHSKGTDKDTLPTYEQVVPCERNVMEKETIQ